MMKKSRPHEQFSHFSTPATTALALALANLSVVRNAADYANQAALSGEEPTSGETVQPLPEKFRILHIPGSAPFVVSDEAGAILMEHFKGKLNAVSTVVQHEHPASEPKPAKSIAGIYPGTMSDTDAALLRAYHPELDQKDGPV